MFRSGARTEVELTSPGVWTRILELSDKVRTDHPDIDIPAGSPKQAPGLAGLEERPEPVLRRPRILEELQAVFTQEAVEQARAFGLLDPAGPGSLCHPHTTRGWFTATGP